MKHHAFGKRTAPQSPRPPRDREGPHEPKQPRPSASSTNRPPDLHPPWSHAVQAEHLPPPAPSVPQHRQGPCAQVEVPYVGTILWSSYYSQTSRARCWDRAPGATMRRSDHAPSGGGVHPASHVTRCAYRGRERNQGCINRPMSCTSLYVPAPPCESTTAPLSQCVHGSARMPLRVHNWEMPHWGFKMHGPQW